MRRRGGGRAVASVFSFPCNNRGTRLNDIWSENQQAAQSHLQICPPPRTLKMEINAKLKSRPLIAHMIAL